VSFRDPDFTRFPRFREALKHAIVAELEPGDALYIPSLWWHHVESIGVLNAMVNYWWSAPAAGGLAKADVLALAMETQ
jgi:oxalate decarboxylase/phosphoglucose isomerase-like protein (cupin superfamily)